MAAVVLTGGFSVIEAVKIARDLSVGREPHAEAADLSRRRRLQIAPLLRPVGAFGRRAAGSPGLRPGLYDRAPLVRKAIGGRLCWLTLAMRRSPGGGELGTDRGESGWKA